MKDNFTKVYLNLINEDFNQKSMYDDDYVDHDEKILTPKFRKPQQIVTINNGDMIDITTEMFKKAGIDTSIPVYDVFSYDKSYQDKTDGYTGHIVVITNNKEEAEQYSNVVQELQIDDDGNAWLNVSIEDEKFSKAHIICKWNKKQIFIVLIK